MDIDRKEIRKKIWAYLKGNPKTSMGDIKSNLTAEFNLGDLGEYLPVIFEEVYSLLIKGIIIFGDPTAEMGSQNAFPWIMVTEYGKKCLDAEELIPLDPEGYIDILQKKVTDIDEITLKYISESINAFNRDALISAAITLGVASEQMMLLLIETYTTSLKNNTEREKFISRTKGRYAETQYREFRKSFDSHKRVIDAEVSRDIDVWLDGTFRFIKLIRNEQGHPTNIEIDKGMINANLHQFPTFASRMYNLIGWFKRKKNSL